MCPFSDGKIVDASLSDCGQRLQAPDSTDVLGERSLAEAVGASVHDFIPLFVITILPYAI